MLCDIANVERKIPREWINEAGNDVLPPCLDYMRPLIQGEVHVKFKERTASLRKKIGKVHEKAREVEHSLLFFIT